MYVECKVYYYSGVFISPAATVSLGGNKVVNSVCRNNVRIIIYYLK